MGHSTSLRGKPPAAPPEAPLRLSDLLARQALAPGRVITYAAAIADGLLQLHRKGFAHGAVACENIWIEQGKASLAPIPAGCRPESIAEDTLQFGIVLRAMLSAAAPHSGDRASADLHASLERIASIYWSADPQNVARDLNRAALALRLLRVKSALYKAASAPALSEWPAVETPRKAARVVQQLPAMPAVTALQVPRRRKALLVIRIVRSPAAENELPILKLVSTSWPWSLGLALLLGMGLGFLGVFLYFKR